MEMPTVVSVSASVSVLAVTSVTLAEADVADVLHDLRRDATAAVGSSNFTGLDADWYQGFGWFENGYVELWTMRLYATFDGDDNGVLSVFGIPGSRLWVETFDGAFYNHPLGSATPPLDLRPQGIWASQWDTYLTINAVESTGDQTQTAGVDESLSTSFETDNGGWFVTPDSPQHRVQDGRVLLTQMTVACDGGVQGRINLLLADARQHEGLHFFFQPTEANEPARPQIAGGDCNQNCLEDFFDVGLGYSRDCNANEIPDECEDSPCLRADLDCSGVVDFGDLIVMLENWGPCGVCDEDLDYDRQVGFQEILAVLGAWGECPQ